MKKLFILLCTLLLGGCLTTQKAGPEQPFERARGTQITYGTLRFIKRTVDGGILHKAVNTQRFVLPPGVPDFTRFGRGNDMYPEDAVHVILFPVEPGKEAVSYSHFAVIVWFFGGEFTPIGISYTDVREKRRYWIYQQNIPQKGTKQDLQALMTFYSEKEKAVKAAQGRQKTT